ncbi:MAG TPA: hypothetical protein VN959_15820 [Mycobacterium sp.]|nr:hypothetical protein [Mycobacterium sp.]
MNTVPRTPRTPRTPGRWRHDRHAHARPRVAASQPNGLDAGATTISTSLTGTFFAQLSIGVLGALLITGEYSTGMIRASLAVVPARLPMLWAKLAVCAGAVFFVNPPLAPLLPASWSGHFVQYLPSNAGAMMLQGTHGLANPLSPWTGFAVMCAYALALIAFAAWRLSRVDA